jgi:hypothetical protein
MLILEAYKIAAASVLTSIAAVDYAFTTWKEKKKKARVAFSNI